MYNDHFRARYTTIPFATYEGIYGREQFKYENAEFSHMHKEIEIIYVLDGKASFVIDTDRYDIVKGDMVIVAPYTLHRSEILSDCDFHHVCICFDLSIIHDDTLARGLEEGSVSVISRLAGAKKLGKLVLDAFEAHKESKPGWELRSAGAMMMLLGILREQGHIYSAETPTKNSVCFDISNYIAEHYSENITSADVARALHINNSYFCRVFKRNYGECFQNYLCLYRIEKAKKLLLTTDMSVSDVATNVGFNSFSYFGEKFKKSTGVTPGKYRMMQI